MTTPDADLRALVDALVRAAVNEERACLAASRSQEYSAGPARVELRSARTALDAALAAQAEALRAAEARATEAERRIAAACKLLGSLIDHFDAMDGEEDSALLAADLRNIARALRGPDGGEGEGRGDGVNPAAAGFNRALELP